MKRKKKAKIRSPSAKDLSLDDIFDLEARYSANAGSGLGRKSRTIGAKKERPRQFRAPSTGLMITKGPINGPKVTNADVRAALDRADKEWSPGYASREEGVAALIIAEGGCVSVDEACYLYRKPIPVIRQTLVEAIFRGDVIGYQARDRWYRVPVWQFRPEGGLLKGLRKVLHALRDKVPGYDKLYPFAFFLQPDMATDGRTPLAALRDGEIKKVLDAVKDRGH